MFFFRRHGQRPVKRIAGAIHIERGNREGLLAELIKRPGMLR
jgi:hypothetical protein